MYATGWGLLWLVLGTALAGLVSGYCTGLFGVGGGILRIPLFVLLFSLFGASDQALMRMATGTSLALVMPGTLSASRRQYLMGKLDIKYLKSWAPAILLGAVAAELALPFLSYKVLAGFFIVFLLSMAFYHALAPAHFVLAKAPPEGVAKGLLATFIGSLSLFIGVGGAALTTPIMTLLNSPIKQAIALSSATAALVSTVGTIGALFAGWDMPGRPVFALGYVDIVVFLVMLPMVMLSAPFGVKTANLMDPRSLRLTYALFLLMMAAYLFVEIVLLAP